MKVDMRIRDFMTGMIVRGFSCHRKLRPMTQKMLRGKAQRTIKTLCLPGFLPLHWLPPW